ncbi:MAG: general secretion pathway protein D [Pseudohongiellaceae bacterium]|jgi:general secretion pathway protein D
MLKLHRKRIFTKLIVLMMLFSQALLAADTLRMNMRDADIRALIQWVADNTNKNIVVHKDVQGKVTVISSEALSSDEAYQVFLSVLDIHGFAAIDTGTALKIIPKNIANSGLALDTNSGSNADMVVSVVKLKHISASKLVSNLRPLIGKNAILSANPESNSLIIADHANNITHIRKLINELDKTNDSEIELIKLKFANASDILGSLKSLFPSDAGSSQLKLSIDERSNSLLITGNPAQKQQIKKLIQKLDTELIGDGNTQVIYLHYVDAKELVPILKSLSSSIQSDKKETTSAISVESSDTANALIINAPPGMLTTMKRVIKQLDIRRAQVLVEALVVEVTGDVGEDLGVTWLADGINASGDGIAGAANTLGDLPLSLGGQVAGDFSTGRGLNFGYFENGDLRAAIRALDATTKANILSTPTIVALDNEEASLLVGQNVPFITGQSTGSSSNNDPFTTIERRDVGISLIITPRINRGDSITLEIKQKTESIAPSLASASDLITNKREILTKALIKDGQMLVLGGLISDEQTEKEEKIPILGDIPFFGALFRSTSTDHIKKNLMVFIHPVILKDEQHISDITQKRYQFMQGLRQRALERSWDQDVKAQTKMEDFTTYTPDLPTVQ